MRGRVVLAAPEPSRLVEKLEPMVLDQIRSQRLNLPTLPTAAAQCLQLIQDPSWSMNELTAALARDPVLTAQVLRMANSAAFGNGIHTMVQAVARLGSERLRSVLVEACARQLFTSRNAQIAAACRGLWEHSVGVALLARDLATVARAPERETIYLTGLLHDVGKPVMAAMLLEAERALGGGDGSWIASENWIAVVQRSHRAVGLALAERWGLPPTVLAIIREGQEYDATTPHSAGNFVRFANATTKLHNLYVGEADPEETSAQVETGCELLGVEAPQVQRLVEGLVPRIHAVTI